MPWTVAVGEPLARIDSSQGTSTRKNGLPPETSPTAKTENGAPVVV
jgi:hypothetical protein